MTDLIKHGDVISGLPIFPLSLVLFPGELTGLHIFERRYREMLADIGTVGGRFGIVYFEPENEFLLRPNENVVGTVCEVFQCDSLDDGRSNIEIGGIARFRLNEYIDAGTGYFQAIVTTFFDDAFDANTLDPLAREVFELFSRVTRAAQKMSGSGDEPLKLVYQDHESLSFLVAAGFGFPSQKKQELLDMLNTEERLLVSAEILRSTVAEIEHRSEVLTAAKTNGHSKKPIDQ